jgi:hypothetical protein|tara:strand:+ start:410 stop:610 length:201 start_codon:yes stop_codon:yes gene_type:complete
MYINDNSIYATGWYSLSPAFAGWNTDVHRLAAIKARREAERIAEEDKKQKEIDSAKIAEGTISIYA